MAKLITKLLEDLEKDLEELDIPSEVLTWSLLVYTHASGTTRTGHIRVNVATALKVIKLINKRISKVRKLEKRLEKLEKKLK